MRRTLICALILVCAAGCGGSSKTAATTTTTKPVTVTTTTRPVNAACVAAFNDGTAYFFTTLTACKSVKEWAAAAAVAKPPIPWKKNPAQAIMGICDATSASITHTELKVYPLCAEAIQGT